MSPAAEQSTILRFPTKRRRPYPQVYVRPQDLPENAVAFPWPEILKENRLPAVSSEMAILTAVFCTLSQEDRRHVLMLLEAGAERDKADANLQRALNWASDMQAVL